MRRMIRFITIVMMAGHFLNVFSFGQDILSYDKDQIKEQVIDICSRNYGPPFFDKIPPQTLETVILFLQRPTKFFGDIRGIGLLQGYISLYGRYMHETRGTNSLIMATFLDKHFKTMDNQKVLIMTHLLLCCSDGLNGSLLASSYIDLFKLYPKVFIRTLKKRSDWRRVVDEFLPEDPDKFIASMEKLGNSKYEKEFKEYVFSRYQFIKDRLRTIRRSGLWKDSWACRVPFERPLLDSQ